jgi:hypothetical protein
MSRASCILSSVIRALGFVAVVASSACAVAPTSVEQVAQAEDEEGERAVMWQNHVTGQLESWVVNNGDVSNIDFLSQTCGAGDSCSDSWKVVDTQANTILWFNKVTGHLRTWVFDQFGAVTIPPDLSQVCGASDGCSNDWRPIGRVLFKATDDCPPCDPQDDLCVCFPGPPVEGLLWHNPTSGAVEIWWLAGSTVTGTATLSQTCGAAAHCSQAWTATLTGDFNGDQNSDLLWFNASTGQVEIWTLQTIAHANNLPVIGVSGFPILSWTCSEPAGCAQHWRIAGAGDVNGDGHLDLLWHNASGTVSDAPPGTLRHWLLDGNGNVTGSRDFSMTCSEASSCATSWTALGYVDYPVRGPT